MLRGGRPVALAILCLALGVGGGCTTPTEGDRQANHQNKGAGRFIKTTATDPEVKQAGADVEANSETLEKNLIGPPAERKPYSPQASKEAREQSDKEHAESWLWTAAKGALAAAAGWFGRGGFIRLFGLLFPTVAAGPLGAVGGLLTTAIARVREAAAENGGQIKIEGEGGLLEILTKEAASNPAAHALIRELAHRAEAKLAAKL